MQGTAQARPLRAEPLPVPRGTRQAAEQTLPKLLDFVTVKQLVVQLPYPDARTRAHNGHTVVCLVSDLRLPPVFIDTTLDPAHQQC